MKTAFRIVSIILALSLLPACSRMFGWGVVLWTVDPNTPDAGATGAETSAAVGSAPLPVLYAGTIVPIYIKSNINRVYVVGIPGSREKMEIPLWRIETFGSRGDAERYTAKFSPCAALYGITVRDGLSLRKAPSNLEKQVYRFRQSEPVKLLEKVKGEDVMTGGKRLEGDWYLALASDGTRGYVFSNQLRMYDETKEKKPVPAEDIERSADIQSSFLFTGTWRPDYFAIMAAENRVDLATFDLRYGLFPDSVRKNVRAEAPGFSRVVQYSSIVRQPDGRFRFDKQPVLLRFSGPDKVTVIVEEGGGTAERTFVKFEGDVRAIIQTEQLRRSTAVSAIARLSPFFSDERGSLDIRATRRFSWTSYGNLAPSDAGENGSLEADLFPAPELAARWDGGVSLRFDGGDKPIIRLAYKLDGSTIRMALIDPTTIEFGVFRAVTSESFELQGTAR